MGRDSPGGPPARSCLGLARPRFLHNRATVCPVAPLAAGASRDDLFELGDDAIQRLPFAVHLDDAQRLSVTARAPGAPAPRRFASPARSPSRSGSRFGIGLHPLTLPEEGRYVGVAWEMLRSGDWLVPTAGRPAVLSQAAALLLADRAVDAAVRRQRGGRARWRRCSPRASARSAFTAVVRRRLGAGLADTTVLVLATLPFFFAAAQFANLDLLVAACIALAIVFAADAALSSAPRAPHRRALVLAWACAALGVLAKGLIGVVLPGLVLIVWLLATGQARTIAAPALAARARGVRAHRRALVRRRPAALSRLRALLLRLPALRALHRGRLQQRAAVVVLPRRRAAADAAVVALAGARAPARSPPAKTPTGSPGAG